MVENLFQTVCSEHGVYVHYQPHALFQEIHTISLVQKYVYLAGFLL